MIIFLIVSKYSISSHSQSSYHSFDAVMTLLQFFKQISEISIAVYAERLFTNFDCVTLSISKSPFYDITIYGSLRNNLWVVF